MVKDQQFKSAARLAIQNVNKHGDTDILPFPFENHIFFDTPDKVIELITKYNDNFENYLTRFSPLNINALTPVSYSGFRWATQLDPIWNLYLLSCVLTIGKKIEKARVPITENKVFSYRYKPNKKTGDLFDQKYSWFQFMENSIKKSEDCEFIVACDISEFYPRIGHHRIENALQHVAGDTPYPSRIIKFLSNFSNTRSFGLPIGGPAARILSELTINQIDRLLLGNEIQFTRFADDYHLFAQSREDAYHHLIFLSEKLYENQGLSLQKSKTRIMSSAEFRATNPISQMKVEGSPKEKEDASVLSRKGSQFLRFALKFDPYSATAEDDYKLLKSELRQFDVFGLLKEELAKSRVHTALARKVVKTIRHLDKKTKNGAVLSIIENSDVLYPIFGPVLWTIDDVFDELEETTQNSVVAFIRNLIESCSHVLRLEVHLAYAIRVLAHKKNAGNQVLLQKLYDERLSPLIRRDIILVLARWGEWYWLSDRKNHFRTLSGAERRAILIASYSLKDEGNHWRRHIKKELNPFEELLLDWADKKSKRKDWKIPL